MKSINRNEIYRKFIHLLGGIIPLSYNYFFDKWVMFDLLLTMSLVAVLLEYFRLNNDRIEGLFETIFGFGIRKKEINAITGASYYAVTSLLTIYLFPKEIAVSALLILSFADTAGALVGIPFGKHAFLSKSREGSTAFFLTASFVLIMFTTLPILYILITALIVTFVEALPSKINDNFTIPVSAGIVMSVFTMVTM